MKFLRSFEDRTRNGQLIPGNIREMTDDAFARQLAGIFVQIDSAKLALSRQVIGDVRIKPGED